MENYKNCKKYLEQFIHTFQKDKKKNIFRSEIFKTEKIYLNQCREIIKGQRDNFTFDLEDLLTTPYSELKDLAFFNTLRFLDILSSNLISLISKKVSSLSASKMTFLPLNQNKTKWLKKEPPFLENNQDFQIILVPPKSFPIETF